MLARAPPARRSPRRRCGVPAARTRLPRCCLARLRRDHAKRPRGRQMRRGGRMESDVGELIQGPVPRAVRHEPDERYADVGRLVITCPDRPGIVAAVSEFLFEAGANITESQQYSTDPFGGTFFLRLEFHLGGLDQRAGELGERFARMADRFSMRWKLTRAADRKRVAIMGSRTDHALQEILWRAQSGELHADIRMIISNHTDAGEAAAWWGLPFHHLPVPPPAQDAAETAQLQVLARAAGPVILA